MTRTRRKEGPRAPLFYWAAALLLLSAERSVAQSVELSSLEVCANLETSELKLACFEAIIATGKSREEQAPEIAVQEARENAPAATVPEISATTAFENEPKTVDPADSIASAPETLPVAIGPEPDVAETPVPPEPNPVVSVTPSAEDFGREQLAARELEEKNEFIRAMVVNVTQGYNKTLYFHLANGHVWRQIEPRRLQYPKDREFEINISQGMMGEYRLRIGEKGRMVRIRRVE